MSIFEQILPRILSQLLKLTHLKHDSSLSSKSSEFCKEGTGFPLPKPLAFNHFWEERSVMNQNQRDCCLLRPQLSAEWDMWNFHLILGLFRRGFKRIFQDNALYEKLIFNIKHWKLCQWAAQHLKIQELQRNYKKTINWANFHWFINFSI